MLLFSLLRVTQRYGILLTGKNIKNEHNENMKYLFRAFVVIFLKGSLMFRCSVWVKNQFT